LIVVPIYFSKQYKIFEELKMGDIVIFENFIMRQIEETLKFIVTDCPSSQIFLYSEEIEVSETFKTYINLLNGEAITQGIAQNMLKSSKIEFSNSNEPIEINIGKFPSGFINLDLTKLQNFMDFDLDKLLLYT